MYQKTVYWKLGRLITFSHSLMHLKLLRSFRWQAARLRWPANRMGSRFSFSSLLKYPSNSLTTRTYCWSAMPNFPSWEKKENTFYNTFLFKKDSSVPNNTGTSLKCKTWPSYGMLKQTSDLTKHLTLKYFVPFSFSEDAIDNFSSFPSSQFSLAFKS